MATTSPLPKDPQLAFDELTRASRSVFLVETTSELLGWDQEVLMPPGGVGLRSEQLAMLAELGHERASAPRLGDLLDLAAPAAADPDRAIQLARWRRDYERRRRVPAALVGETAAVASRAQHAWAEARRTDDFAAFAPWLERSVELARARADHLGVPADGHELWDALAEDHEPGMRAADLERLFAPLRSRLGGLVQELTLGRRPSERFRAVRLPAAQQEGFVRFVVEALGFDFRRGRLDRSTHPFCSGTSPGDVRITTRFGEADLGDALGSTMHEAGHGLYEQGLPADLSGTPLGSACSLGIHESQSRLWENHVGRSAAFWRWCRPHLPRFFGSALADFDDEELFGAANLVAPSLIRVEADEATYNLHVMVRFELERALIDGRLAVRDLPGAWRELYHRYLGIEVPSDRFGCLQDVHWSCGLYGYFPTYTLGSLYAAQFYAAAERALPDLDAQLEHGRFDGLLSWLRQHVHATGRRHAPDNLCREATGSGLDANIFLHYLEAKLRPLYRPE